MRRYQLALVTGASSGLGEALCRALAKRKIPLILAARSEQQLAQLARDLPVTAKIHKVDLSDSEERKVLIQRVRREVPDLIINNAGFGLYGPTLAHSSSELNAMLEVNIKALMELSVEAARALFQARKKGTILNVSSAASFFSYPTFCVYAATKAFVNHFSQGLDSEMKPHGIRVLTVCPGQIETGFRARASGNYPQEKDRMTMTPQQAAQHILKQIARGQRFSIIDGRYRLLIALSRLLPKSLIETILKKSLEKRHRFSLKP